jgi:site-specific DNA-adenine methylase
MKRIPNLMGVKFQHKNYSKVLFNSLKVERPMVMYLDPPYESTTRYYGLPPFDSARFWGNVRVVSKKHYVLTSSYQAPDDFRAVREWASKTGMNAGHMERLYAIGKILEDYAL